MSNGESVEFMSSATDGVLFGGGGLILGFAFALDASTGNKFLSGGVISNDGGGGLNFGFAFKLASLTTTHASDDKYVWTERSRLMAAIFEYSKQLYTPNAPMASSN